MENTIGTTSQNKYTSPIKSIATLGVIALLIGFGFYTYASTPSLTLEEIEMRKTAEMLKAQTQIDMDNLKTLSDCHDIAEREARYPDEYMVIRSECYEKGKKPDVLKGEINANGEKVYPWTSSGATRSSAPWWSWNTGSVTTHVISEVNEKKDSSKGVEKRESDDSRTKQTPLTPQTIQTLLESKNLSLLEVLWLDQCRVTQNEDSHITLKGGHIYGTDIACEVWKSFTVSAPQWKKEYTVIAVGQDKRLGNYIVLEHKNYRFVFAHTNSPHKVGDKIPAGAQIGYSDDSWLATGIHVHFELWRDGYNITHHEMIGQGSKWNDSYSFRLLTQRGWHTGIDDAIAYITSFEWYRAESYEDPKGSGKWSIWYGTHADGPGEKISKDEAKKRIRSKVAENMDFIYRNRLAFTWNQRIALSSFFYNLGTGRPEMVQALKKRDMKSLEKLWKSYINKWSIYESGLLKRRVKEWSKFISQK